MNALLALAAGVILAAQAQSGSADRVFDAWDADGNGVLSHAEFGDGWKTMIERSIAARLRAQFDKLDRNGDESLDGAEYATLALVMQAGKDAPAMAGFDANGDKRLQFDEYIASVRSLVAANRKPESAQP